MFCSVGKQTHSNGILLYIIGELPAFNGKNLKFSVLVIYYFAILVILFENPGVPLDRENIL